MERLTLFPGSLPFSAECGEEDQGATVYNRAGSTVYYSDSRLDADNGTSDGSIAVGGSVTLYGTQWFWVLAGGERSFVDIASLPVVESGSSDAILELDSSTGRQASHGTLLRRRAKQDFALPADEFFIPATEFSALNDTTPTFIDIGPDRLRNGWPAWNLDATTAEAVACVTRLPHGWGTDQSLTVEMVLWWINPANSTGNVVWQVHHSSLYPGVSISSDDTHDAQITSAAAGQWATSGTFVIGGVTLDPSYVHRFEIRRFADHGSDTLANDAAVLGLMLQRSRVPSGWTKT